MKSPRCLLLQVIDPQSDHQKAEQDMLELESLVATFGGSTIVTDIQHRRTPHPATYVGAGKVEWLETALEEHAIDIVIFNAVVKPSQLFRVEKTLWKTQPRIKVWDKVDLLLAIFRKHAGSVESKLQIELAQLDHLGPRSYGLGGKELSRQGGGIGTRGKGETNIEFERRVSRQRRQFLEKQLEKAKAQKRHRISRRSELGLGPVALVGYTSAGKTTLFNALTGKAKPTSAKLFTTLDTVVGKMKAPQGNKPIIISDTIGFIQDLPPQLIEAFQSTLLESLNATLILLVFDLSDPEYLKHIEVVESILKKLEASQPIVLVANKIDQASESNKQSFAERFGSYPCAYVSAKNGEGISNLKEIIWNYVR